MNKSEFAKILKNARESAGVSKCELTRRTGFTRMAIQNWEKGIKNITLENADKLLKALGAELTIGGKNE